MATELGSLLRQARRRRGFSLHSLATLVGSSATTLSLAERARRRLDESTLVRIGRSLDLDPATLILAMARDQLPERLRHEVPGARSDHQGFRHFQRLHFTYEVDRAATVVETDWEGNAVISRHFDGCRPLPGRTLRRIVSRDQIPPGATEPPRLVAREVPAQVPMELHNVVSGSWISHRVVFPNGWRTDDGDGRLSFTLTVRAHRFFQVPPAPAGLGAFTYRMAHLVQHFEMAFCFPPGFEPEEWLDPVAYWDVQNPLEIDRSAADDGICRSWEFTRDKNVGRLTVEAPLVGYSWALRWQPGPPERFLAARAQSTNERRTPQ
jgi:transcriptional regulator with XRE-family HTH domain